MLAIRPSSMQNLQLRNARSARTHRRVTMPHECADLGETPPRFGKILTPATVVADFDLSRRRHTIREVLSPQ